MKKFLHHALTGIIIVAVLALSLLALRSIYPTAFPIAIQVSPEHDHAASRAALISYIPAIVGAPQLSESQIGYSMYRTLDGRSDFIGMGPFKITPEFWAKWGQGTPYGTCDQWGPALAAVRRSTEARAPSAWDFGDLRTIMSIYLAQLNPPDRVYRVSVVDATVATAYTLYGLPKERASDR